MDPHMTSAKEKTTVLVGGSQVLRMQGSPIFAAWQAIDRRANERNKVGGVKLGSGDEEPRCCDECCAQRSKRTNARRALEIKSKERHAPLGKTPQGGNHSQAPAPTHHNGYWACFWYLGRRSFFFLTQSFPPNVRSSTTSRLWKALARWKNVEISTTCRPHSPYRRPYITPTLARTNDVLPYPKKKLEATKVRDRHGMRGRGPRIRFWRNTFAGNHHQPWDQPHQTKQDHR
jgi:hypothetical protein